MKISDSPEEDKKDSDISATGTKAFKDGFNNIMEGINTRGVKHVMKHIPDLNAFKSVRDQVFFLELYELIRRLRENLESKEVNLPHEEIDLTTDKALHLEEENLKFEPDAELSAFQLSDPDFHVYPQPKQLLKEMNPLNLLWKTIGEDIFFILPKIIRKAIEGGSSACFKRAWVGNLCLWWGAVGSTLSWNFWHRWAIAGTVFRE